MLRVWYIYLQNWVIYGVHVGKQISTMEDTGTEKHIYFLRVIPTLTHYSNTVSGI